VQLRGQNVNYGLLWVGGPAEETSVDTESQSKIMMGGWTGGRDICGHRVLIKDHDGWVDRRKRHLWTQSVNQRS
jgi:hypothetical protein